MLFEPNAILFYPDVPHERYTIYKICYLLGYKIVNNPKKNFYLAINWQDCTYRTSDDELSNLIKKFEVINAKCRDISKKKVDSIFKEVFGYSIMIDPLTHKGNCVIKSNINAQHDGKVITCPIDKIKEGYVYQKVINNQFDDNFVQDIRVPIFKEEIPFVYLKYKVINERFSNPSRVVIAKPYEVLSQEEIKKIILFCKKIGLEYGELDVLRDNNDGRLYIVDANSTPYDPRGISEKEGMIALKLLAETFEEVFVNKRCNECN
jgi:hypothetical protein